MNNEGKIITITSRKGGVGKTTTLLNLAGIYSNLEKKVLIMDLDLYSSSISVSLNLNKEKTIYNMVLDITNNKFTEVEDYMIKYNDYISVLSSVNDPRLANHIGVKYIEQIINMVKHYYDVILIDTNHVLNDINVKVYDNSDTIVNVMSNDPVDLVNTKNFITIAKDIEFKDLRIELYFDMNYAFFNCNIGDGDYNLYSCFHPDSKSNHCYFNNEQCTKLIEQSDLLPYLIIFSTIPSPYLGCDT